jgi:hypothetical protein
MGTQRTGPIGLDLSRTAQRIGWASVPARRIGPLVGVTLSGVLWAALLVMRGPPTQAGAVVGAAIVAAVGTAVVGLIARAVLGTEGSDRVGWIGAMAGPVAAIAAIGLALPDDLSSPGGLLVGLVPVAAVSIGAALGGADPRKVRRFGIAAVVWAAAVIGYWVTVDRGPVGELVWQAADQLKYHDITIRLLEGRLDDLRYMVGLPAFIAPFGLLAGAQDGSREAANATNVIALPTFVLLIGPLTVLASAEAVVAVLRRTSELARAAAAAAITAGLVAYARFAPGWVPRYNADLVPRRLLGLVFAPEPLTAVFLAGAMWLLVTSGEGGAKWDPWVVGACAGFVILLREPNAALVALAGVLAIRHRDLLVRVLTAAVVAGAVVGTQVVLWLSTYGGIGAPNRAAQWAQPSRQRRWRIMARDRYGYDGQAPPRVSWDWVSTNLREVLPPYTVALVVLGLLSLVAVVRFPRHWRLWVFCAVFAGGTVLFNAAYINVQVLFRYNSIVLPALLVPAAVGLGALWSRSAGRQSSALRPRRGWPT